MSAEERILLARIGKPHGLRGEVTVQVHTDAPGRRFAVGARVATDPAERGPLTIRGSRLHGTVQLLAFEEAPDRTAAEALRGTRLYLLGAEATEPTDPAAAEDTDDEGWYEDDLLDLAVRLGDGTPVGRVSALHLRPAQDLLEVALADGGTALVPFVEEIVTEVDTDAGVLVLDPPPGLLDLSRPDAGAAPGED